MTEESSFSCSHCDKTFAEGKMRTASRLRRSGICRGCADEVGFLDREESPVAIVTKPEFRARRKER